MVYPRRQDHSSAQKDRFQVKNSQQALIAMGGNLPSGVGSPARTLRAALERLIQSGVEISAVSQFYNTPCFPSGAGPDYVNAAARVTAPGGPEALLRVLHEVEAGFGRERVERWGRRTLDLDLIAVGEAVLPDPGDLGALACLAARSAGRAGARSADPAASAAAGPGLCAGAVGGCCARMLAASGSGPDRGADAGGPAGQGQIRGPAGVIPGL